MPTVVELKKKCKDLGIKGYSKLKKNELEDLIKKKSSKQVAAVKQKKTIQKNCNPNNKKYKENPSLYVCNPKTGHWVLKSGKMGKELVKKQKNVQKQKDEQKQKDDQKSIVKDVPILDYKIGKPISKKEAEEHFYKPAKLKQGETFVDPITLQQVEEKDLIQLKESNELMSKESFQEYVNNNATTWCGKQNVGFKSPDETIFGNLVLFNFDTYNNFYPQHSGTLFIEIYSDNYYKLRFKNYNFYVPKTKDGELLICMMKDAFKKGNLFAHSKSGTIRHGRVHKKTSIHGTHGFPDPGYIERCMGELNKIGSSPYIYQFSNDKLLQLHVDPYPAEKRWKIQANLSKK